MNTNELNIYTEKRPWGNFTEFSKEQPSVVKIIRINPNEATSLQSHKKRDEFWHLIGGNGFITIDNNRTPANSGDEFFVLRNSKHRLEAGNNGLRLLEISLGDFEETDETRFDDKYGRAQK